MLSRLLTFLAFAIAIVALGEWDAKNRRFAFTEKVNQWWLDFCVGNARDKIHDPKVSFVSIGDDYEPVLDGDSLSRLDYVVLLGYIEKFKPRAVSVAPVISFPEPNVLNQGALKKQVLKMPRLTLGSVAEAGSPAANDAEKPNYPTIEKVEGDITKVALITRAVSVPDEEPRSNGVSAFTEIELSDTGDSAAPMLPLIGRVGDKLVASFALQALISDADLTLEDVQIKLPPATKDPQIRVGDRYRIPVDAAGRLASYPHSGVTPPFYPVVNAKNLPLTADEGLEFAQLDDDFDSLKKNLVVVGENGKTAAKVALPNGESYSQHEYIARAIALVQSGRYIERWPEWAKYVGIAVIVLLAAFLFRLRRMPLLFWGFVTAFLYVFGICLGSFKEWLVWTPPFVPLALFAGILLVGLILPSAADKALSEEKSDSEEEDPLLKDAPATE